MIRTKKKASEYLPGNQAILIRGGRDYFDLLLKLIGEARETIHLQTYIFDPDETGTSVASALVDAARRGVKIHMLLDAFGSQNIDDDFLKWLKSEGIHVRKFHAMIKSKRYYFGRRLHHKVVVIDSWKCVVSGLNISNRYNDMPDQPAWLDWALYAEGPIAIPLEDICIRRMKGRRQRHTVVLQQLKGHLVPIRVRVNDWLGRKREIYRSYLEMFRRAESHVVIMSAYFLPGRLFRKAIEDAIRRGVRIKVVVTAHSDVFLIKYAERYIYRWLFKNKVEVYEYQPNVLHAKIAFCDGNWMTVGSFNVNNLSAFSSIELNLEIKDEVFVKKQEARIEKVIHEDCVRITEKKFNRQFNSLSRAAQHVAYQVFRFLFFLSTKQRKDF